MVKARRSSVGLHMLSQWKDGSNLRQIHLAIRDNYILQSGTNIVGNLTQIHFTMRDKYILQCETNIFDNLRKIHLGV